MARRDKEPSANQGIEAFYSMTVSWEILSELGRATTAYYDATPDLFEQARREYEEALRKFDAIPEFPRL